MCDSLYGNRVKEPGYRKCNKRRKCYINNMFIARNEWEEVGDIGDKYREQSARKGEYYYKENREKECHGMNKEDNTGVLYRFFKEWYVFEWELLKKEPF